MNNRSSIFIGEKYWVKRPGGWRRVRVYAGSALTQTATFDSAGGHPVTLPWGAFYDEIPSTGESYRQQKQGRRCGSCKYYLDLPLLNQVEIHGACAYSGELVSLRGICIKYCRNERRGHLSEEGEVVYDTV